MRACCSLGLVELGLGLGIRLGLVFEIGLVLGLAMVLGFAHFFSFFTLLAHRSPHPRRPAFYLEPRTLTDNNQTIKQSINQSINHFISNKNIQFCRNARKLQCTCASLKTAQNIGQQVGLYAH